MQTKTANRQLRPIQIGIIVTALITALIHWYLVQSLIRAGLSPTLFILNGLGYVGMLVAYLLPQALVSRVLPRQLAQAYRPVVRYGFMAYTLLTIILWAVMGERTPIAYIDKLAEVALLVLLWLDRSSG